VATAAERGSVQAPIVSDITTDPFWAGFRDLAAAGLAACWSTPILARDGTLLGIFAIYHRVPRAPQQPDLALARVFAETAALAIEHHQATQASTSPSSGPGILRPCTSAARAQSAPSTSLDPSSASPRNPCCTPAACGSSPPTACCSTPTASPKPATVNTSNWARNASPAF
jgi:GAF domain